MEIKQYEIILVNLDPTLGSETTKKRPCLVLSPDEMNKYLHTLIIAPITSSSRKYPSRTEIKSKSVNGWIMIDQLKTIDGRRIIKQLGRISEQEILHVKQIIQELLVD